MTFWGKMCKNLNHFGNFFVINRQNAAENPLTEKKSMVK